MSNDLLQKVLALVPLTETGPEVYVATMTTIISDSYYSMMDTTNQMKNLKLKDHPGRDAADFHEAILVNVESLESAGASKPEHLVQHYYSIKKLWRPRKYWILVQSLRFHVSLTG